MHPPYARNRKKMYNSPFFTVQKVETCTAFHSKKRNWQIFFPARRSFLEFSCQEGGGVESLKFPAIQIPPWSSPHFCGSRRQRLPGPTVADGRSRGRRSPIAANDCFCGRQAGTQCGTARQNERQTRTCVHSVGFTSRSNQDLTAKP